MKVRSIKTNYILNISRTVLSSLIGLFTLPYINRVLGVESVGKFEYANSIITYFVLFSALGIPMYGIREVAKVRDNIYQRTKVLSELLIILSITTIISYIVLFGFFIHLDFLKDYKTLIFVLAPIIFLGNFGVEWFFQGVEDQVYITIRFIVIKIATLLLLFSFVKSPDDYLSYGAIMVISTVGSNIFNFFYIRKFVNFKIIELRSLEIRKHLRGVLTIFLATVSVSVYLQVDNTLLGIYGSDKNVGLYATANKLVRFAILFVTTLGSVMLPRLSNLYDNGKYEEYNLYLSKSLKYILFFSVPACVLIYGLAEKIIYIMAGNEFSGAILPMKILSFLLLLIGLAYYLAFMVMYPQGKERLYTLIVFISAILSIVLNLIYIPQFFERATSIVSVVVEALGVMLMIIILRKELCKFNFFSIKNLNYIIGGGLLYLIIFIVNYFKIQELTNILLSSFLGLIIYFIFLYVVKDFVVHDFLKKIKKIRYGE